MDSNTLHLFHKLFDQIKQVVDGVIRAGLPQTRGRPDPIGHSAIETERADDKATRLQTVWYTFYPRCRHTIVTVRYVTI